MPEYDAVHSQSPETYLFLGVQIKILLSHRGLSRCPRFVYM